MYIKDLKTNDRNWWEAGSSPWDFTNMGQTVYGGENQTSADTGTGSIGGITWPTTSANYNVYPNFGTGLSGFEFPELPSWEAPSADPGTTTTAPVTWSPTTGGANWMDYLALASMGKGIYGLGEKAYDLTRDMLGSSEDMVGSDANWESLQNDWDAINQEMGDVWSSIPSDIGQQNYSQFASGNPWSNIVNYSPTSFGESLSSAMDLGLGNVLETDLIGLTPATEFGGFMESIGGMAGLGAAAAGLMAFDTLVRLMPGGDPEGVVGGLKKTLGAAFGLTSLDSMTPEQAKVKLGSSVEYLGRAADALANGGQPSIYNWLLDPLNAYSGADNGAVAEAIQNADIYANVAGYTPEETQQLYVDYLGQDVADAVAAVRSVQPQTAEPAAQAVNTEAAIPIETLWQQQDASKGDLGLIDELALLSLTDWYDPSMAEMA